MKKAILIILDGFGLRTDPTFNAVLSAKTPNLSRYMRDYAYGELNASEHFVGLPSGQFGNSEVGHLNLGAGRVIRQDISKIDYAIESGEFATNPAFAQAFAQCQSGNLHLMGLLSDGGVHSHQLHLFELIKLAAQQSNIQRIWVHAFLDGRDTPPQSAIKFIQQLQTVLANHPQAKLASLTGRYYAMDRDQRWERIELAYRALTEAKGEVISDPVIAINNSYQQGVNDEFIQPLIMSEYTGMRAGDSIIFTNFRADRAIQLTSALISPEFNGFARQQLELASFVSMTRYQEQFKCAVAFPPQPIQNTLGEYLSKLGYAQLRIAETEKYPHVTYFFNGGEQQPFPREDRILIASPKEVATYDLKPEMSLPQVAEQIVAAINADKHQLIITNFANCDMVGHTGNFAASIQAVEAVDKYVGQVVTAMQAAGGEVLIVADHGNCEEMFDPQVKQPHTQHTTNHVPCIYIGRKAKITRVGSLQDVAPSLLQIMGIPQPQEMSGTSLITFE